MRQHFERSLENIIRHGDTDIFPFPLETLIFYDKRAEVLDLLEDIHSNFRQRLASFPPANEGALAPITYTGFRWATQLDPVWNAYYLGLVLSGANEIERARIPSSEKMVFSYRYLWNADRADIFDSGSSWRNFMECSLENAKRFEYVVICDISEFYLRLSHHRLENALKQAQVDADIPWRIMEFLSNFSNTNSFGIPVGGPASRLLSELVLNQIDRLLKAEGIRFCRFADDFHIFSHSEDDAYTSLLFLSEKLLQNQGLQLQKSKTRLMSRAEFIATSPLHLNDEDDAEAPVAFDRGTQARRLMRFSLRFDPYSPTAEEDYELLREEIERFDILGLLKSELAKTRIHISLAKKIIAAIKFLDPVNREAAVLSLIDNFELLYPVLSSVMIVAKSVFDDLSAGTQEAILRKVIELIQERSHVLRVDLNLIYAIRLLACRPIDDAEDTLSAIYKRTTSALLRRDIILVMAKWGIWYWLSDLRNHYRALTRLSHTGSDFRAVAVRRTAERPE